MPTAFLVSFSATPPTFYYLASISRYHKPGKLCHFYALSCMLYRPFKTKPSKYIEHSDNSDYYIVKTGRAGVLGKPLSTYF
jgi:hypothetical protein